MENNKLHSTKSEIKNAIDTYPGVAVDIADGENVSKQAVENATCTLNNNPENEGKII